MALPMTFIDGKGTNGLMIIADRRTETDTQIGGFMRLWGFGRHVLGHTTWQSTLRVALLDHKEQPFKAKDMAGKRRQIDKIIKQHNIRTVCVLQSQVIPNGRTTNLAWQIFKPGSPFNWAGTVLYEGGLQICPILHPHNYEWAYHWLIRRQLLQAHYLATGKMAVRAWPKEITINPKVEDVARLARSPYLAVDIETDSQKKIISAVGISDGKTAISAPWDDFVIAGTDRWQVGASASVKSEIRALLASPFIKIGHNFAFDVYNLRQRGIEVNGELHDTLLMSHSIFPQFRKGLQHCAAMCFAVEPWKSLHKPPHIKNGDKWLATPEATRLYNCKDAVATAWIYEHFMGLLT